jgi:hypothetical protein
MSGATMTTRSGIEFDLLRPLPTMVLVEDVAYHTARLNRWCGAARRTISVAEHALLVVEILERDFGVRAPLVLRAGLHHDSEEAYTGDLTGPMKALLRALGVDFNGCTERIRDAVRQHFGIAAAAVAHRDLIKQADTLSRHTEYRDLVCRPSERDLHPPGVSWIDLNSRGGMTAHDWTVAFLDKHDELAHRCAAQEPTP